MVQLRYFAISPPTLIAIPGFVQIRICKRLETTCCVESRGDFIGNSLMVDESIGVRRADGLFVKAFGFDHAAFYSRDFSTHECGTVFKIVWAMLRPNYQLPMTSSERLEMVSLLIRQGRIPRRSVGERAIEVKKSWFKYDRRGCCWRTFNDASAAEA